MSRLTGMCPYCGEIVRVKDGLTVYHSYPKPTRQVCKGSKQNARNPETDKRPLWKDLPPEPPRPVKKYLVQPGYVRSRNDGQRHYITATKLMQLYEVDPRECIALDRHGETFGLIADDLRKLPVLRPRYSGDYTLPA